jgi:hypothetical protein
MTCYAATYGTLQASKFWNWITLQLNYADRDKISAVDQLILTTSNPFVRLMRTSSTIFSI